MRQITITDEESRQRFDKFLMKYFNAAPKSFIYKMLRKKYIKLNALRAAGNEMLKPGDIITIWLTDDTMRSMTAEHDVKPAGALDIVYEDENIIICDKPAGVLSQPDGGNESMRDRLLYYLCQKNEFFPNQTGFIPSVCNRLDRNTGGLLLCAKNLHSAQALGDMLAGHCLDKYYLALVIGKVEQAGVLKGFHTKSTRGNISSILPEGKGSAVITEYRPLRFSEAFSLLEVRLITGKSHQIRAHLESIGHPIAGDPKYGNREVNDKLQKKYGVRSQMLFAARIIMRNPCGRLEYLRGMEFEAKTPEIFTKVMTMGVI